jgi:uncharacterized protein YcbX
MPSIASLHRHPVKGLTPEALGSVELTAGEHFPNDRKWAVEAGPSGFDPEKPAHISKQKFTVLARFPSLARLETRLEDPSLFHIGDRHGFGVAANLATEDGRSALARFLQSFLGDQATGQFRVLSAPGHRFMDSPLGHVSVINLASVRALEWAAGAAVDPLRFRANVYLDGLPPWIEDDWPAGAMLGLGAAKLKLAKPIVRCTATHANTVTGQRDLDTLGLLRDRFGRDTMGCYFSVEQGGRIAVGDSAAPPG